MPIDILNANDPDEEPAPHEIEPQPFVPDPPPQEIGGIVEDGDFC